MVAPGRGDPPKQGRTRQGATHSRATHEKKKAFVILLNREGFIVPWHRSEVESTSPRCADVSSVVKRRQTTIDPEIAIYPQIAPTQEGGQLCFPAKP